MSTPDRNMLEVSDNPFSQFAFLDSLEESKCCSPATGWTAHHVVFRNDQHHILGLMPCYIKDHSWGEYVFDWAWAHAYRENALDYYPKLVTAIPFTPVTGPRFLVTNGTCDNDLLDYWLTTALPELASQLNISSWHLLFSDANVTSKKSNSELLERIDCQFHWRNKEYSSFDAMLETFSSRKRKNIRKERKSITDMGIELRRFSGIEIDQELLSDFYQFYVNTYEIRGHTPHLNMEFFKEILSKMPDKILLVMASSKGQNIAGALFFHDDKTLYGRYWGSYSNIPGLHFECCYYQGIEFCIEHSLKSFNPGTQGEHKISRGFEPVITHSRHWIKHADFSYAIKNFLAQEQQSVKQYAIQAKKLLPFKKE